MFAKLKGRNGVHTVNLTAIVEMVSAGNQTILYMSHHCEAHGRAFEVTPSTIALQMANPIVNEEGFIDLTPEEPEIEILTLVTDDGDGGGEAA